jgi:hypothetical protein
MHTARDSNRERRNNIDRKCPVVTDGYKYRAVLENEGVRVLR